ncbi:MAG: TlpA family protein disulfide reductase [Nitrospirae bacterium]|nr:TlpA family protein disulfide reductase [Nitrospirota bacterium]
MPSLESLYRSFKGEPFELLSVDIEENRDTVSKFLEENNISFDVLLDEVGAVSSQYGVRSTPMKVLIDAKGNLAGVSLGYREWDSDEMRTLIKLLAGSK